MFCLEPTDHTCFADARCGLQGFWGDVARAIEGVFDETTVADLAERHQRRAGAAVLRPGDSCCPGSAEPVDRSPGSQRPTARGRRAPRLLVALLPRIRMTFVPQTGHCPARPSGRS